MLGGAMLKIFFVLISLIYLSSCQPRNNSSSIGDQEVLESFTSTTQMERQLGNWKVECLDPRNYPNSVGQLLITDGRNLTACTATLIGPDTALTNSHCFDRRDPRSLDLINPDKICQSGTRIVFASQSPSGREQLRCKKVLTKSYLGFDGIPPYLYPDYAIIQFEKPTTRKYDLVTREGIEQQMSLSMRKVNPAKSGLGELEVTQCQAQFQTLLSPLATSPHYHVHVLLGCETRTGNSGASVVDNNGTIRGVLYQSIGTQSRAPRTAFEKEIIDRATQEKVSFVANASCMNHNFPGLERRDEKRCIQYKTTPTRMVDALDAGEVQNEFSSSVLSESVSLKSNESFGYRLYFNPVHRTFTYAPYCIKLSTAPYVGIDYPISIDTLLWKWTPQIRVGSKMKAEAKSMSRAQRFCNVTFSYQELNEKGHAFVRLSGSSCIDSKGQDKQVSDRWEVCKP